MGSASYTLTAETDPLIMALMIFFVIFGPVLALNLLIALMADTYSGVNEDAKAEWTACRENADEKAMHTSAKYVLEGAEEVKFVPIKPSNFPQQNHCKLPRRFNLVTRQ